MKFSTRATYGLKALLILADQYGQRAISVSQMAKTEGISRPYLEQILFRLKKKQWIKSLRGPSGGYVLAKSPSEIKIGPILRDLEGNRSWPQDLSSGASRDRENTVSKAAAIFWEKFLRESTDFLDSISLKSLIDEARLSQTSKARSKSHFHI